MNFWTTEIENIRKRKYWKNLKIGPRSGMVCSDLSRNKTFLMGIKNHSTIFLDFCFLWLSRGHVPKFIFVKESCKKLSLIRLSQFHQIAAKIPTWLCIGCITIKEAPLWNGVGSIPAGGKSSSWSGWIVWPPVTQHKERTLKRNNKPRFHFSLIRWPKSYTK